MCKNEHIILTTGMTTDRRKLADIAGVEYNEKEDGIFKDNEIFCILSLWKPDVYVEQAIMVAEKFISWSVGKTTLEGNQRYHAYICTSEVDEMYYRSYGITPAEAICRAALAAKE